MLARTVTEPIPLLEQAVETAGRLTGQARAHPRPGRARRGPAAGEPAGGGPRPAPARAGAGGPRRHAAARRRAREELNAVGARPRRSALSGPGSLTPAEHRVAQLAALGHGNRAIAERLYVTQRTVETHLTHAFQKLDIRSRAELGSALEPQGRQLALAD